MNTLNVVAPGGSLAHVDAALDAGADAVYAGIKGISARPDAWSLDLDMAKEASSRAHARGKRIYFALNAECHESQWAKLEDTIAGIVEVGCDALIVGDWGVLRLLSRQQLGIPLHASTLLGIYNNGDLALARKMGVQRVVLNSNLYLDEISSMIRSHPDMEYELIAFGGICANDCRRCRLPHWRDGDRYHVKCRHSFSIDDGSTLRPAAHPLNDGDIDLSPTLALYAALGITAFKIEGRTREVEYVRASTSRLRKAIDSLAEIKPEALLHYVRQEEDV